MAEIWQMVKDKERFRYQIVYRATVEDLLFKGLLEIGEGTKIDEGVILCHPTRKMETLKVKIGKNGWIRSGTVIYSDVHIGDNFNSGHDVTIREGCRIGNNTSIGTGVKVECYTEIGNYVSIETQAHITGWMKIEDGVFVGGAVMTTNDLKMNWKRAGHGMGLQGAILKKGCQIGSGAILLPGIIVGEYAVVNAGEVVRKDVPAATMMFTAKNEVILKAITPEKIKEIE